MVVGEFRNGQSCNVYFVSPGCKFRLNK